MLIILCNNQFHQIILSINTISRRLNCKGIFNSKIRICRHTLNIENRINNSDKWTASCQCRCQVFTTIRSNIKKINRDSGCAIIINRIIASCFHTHIVINNVNTVAWYHRNIFGISNCIRCCNCQ